MVAVYRNKLDPHFVTLMSGGESVVELGCGVGAPLDELIHCYCVEIWIGVSRRRLDERPSPQIGWRFILVDMDLEIPLRLCCCGAVITNQVIEHIADPKHFAQEIYVSSDLAV